MIRDLPTIGFGTWQIESKDELKNVFAVLKESGYKHIDTAQVYDNEYQIGLVMQELNISRDDFFITSKITPLNYKYVIESTKESLRRLNINQLDLMLLHAGYPNDLLVSAYKDLIKARELGLTRYIGVSNFSIKQLKDIKSQTGEYPYANQIMLAPTFRATELESFCKKNNIKLIGYSIMKSYFEPNPFFKDSGLNAEQKLYIDSLAAKYHKDQGQILSKWALMLGYAIIPKSTKVSRVISNIKLDDFELTSIEMETINNFNKINSDIYEEVIASWAENIDPKSFEIGMLFDKNFKPGK